MKQPSFSTRGGAASRTGVASTHIPSLFSTTATTAVEIPWKFWGGSLAIWVYLEDVYIFERRMLAAGQYLCLRWFTESPRGVFPVV